MEYQWVEKKVPWMGLQMVELMVLMTEILRAELRVHPRVQRMAASWEHTTVKRWDQPMAVSTVAKKVLMKEQRRAAPKVGL